MAGPVRTVAAFIAAALLAAGCATSLELEVRPTGDREPVGDSSASADDAVVAGQGVWEDARCAFTEPLDVSVTCGWLTVPERWDLPDDGDTVRLHVGIFSTGPNQTLPLVYLEGGPGGDALANIAQGFDVLFGRLAEERDVVIVGQRGTGSAEPTLGCDTVAQLDLELLDAALDAADELLAFEDAYVECAEELRGEGIDPAAYNSVQNAHDIDALRAALGHDQWHVVGISYGTRLAQTLMRLHPEGVASAVLDSVLSYEREPTVDIPTVAQRSFEVLFSECEASPECSGAFPDLEERYFALVDRLDAAPVSFEVQNVITGERHDAAMNGTGLLETTFSALYSKSSFAGLPELVDQLERGETSGAETLVSQEVTSAPFFADGMYWAVQCHEEVPFVEPGDAEEGRTGNEYYDRLSPPGTETFLDAVCGALATGAAPPEEDEPLVSDIPTLLLAGTYDPITPPADTRSLLDGLSNATYLEFPHTGHAALVDECAQGITAAFLADPAAPPDDTCIADVAPPPWQPDLFSDVEFEPFSYDLGLVSGSGVAPIGWEAGGDGTFVNSDNSLHLSVLLVQAVAALPPSLLISNLSSVFGQEPTRLDPVLSGGRQWDHYEVTVPGSIIDMFVIRASDATVLVLFQHAPQDRDAALDALLTPMLDAAGP